MQCGRKIIFTDVPEITSENLIDVLNRSVADFRSNAKDCASLLQYEKGIQPKVRKKLFRTEIDYWTVENIANEVAQFKMAYNWGSPITLIQRGEKDSGGSDEADAIATLNEFYDAEEIQKKQQELARFVEICGTGFTIVEINSEWEDGDSPFTINVLDPRYAFVVRSSYYTDHRIVLGVTYRRGRNKDSYFTCYTKNERFDVHAPTGKDAITDAAANPLRRIPITEWIRDFDRMGCFERQIPEMNHLNLMVSDLANDIDQATQAIWHGNDLEFPVDENGDTQKPSSGDWILTNTTPDGKTPFINPLEVDYDYSGMLNQIQYKVNRIKEKCNVPQRSDASNSTGIAVSDASGWTNADIEATKQDQIKYGCKMEEVKCALAAIRETALAKVDEKVLKLRYRDVMPIIKRQKNYELSVKTTALSNLINIGVYGLHAFNTVNLFDDTNQVWEDSRENIEAYQKSKVAGGTQADSEGDSRPLTTDGGYEAQIGNSSRIDGMEKETPITIEGS